MNTIKPGWKTTEFWIALLAEIVPVVLIAFGVTIPPELLAAILSVPPTGYAVSRGIAKHNLGK
jgi:hypothetical protein